MIGVLRGAEREDPLDLLVAGAVLVARVGQGVAVVAVGGGLDEDRALAGAEPIGEPRRRPGFQGQLESRNFGY